MGNREEVKRAGHRWFVLGLMFGVVGFLLALATSKGDGREDKALLGCLIWALIIMVVFLVGAAGVDHFRGAL